MSKKPLSVVYSEFNKNLIDLINNSQLPPFVLEMVLKNFCNDIHSLSQRQLEMDLKSYQESLGHDES